MSYRPWVFNYFISHIITGIGWWDHHPKILSLLEISFYLSSHPPQLICFLFLLFAFSRFKTTFFLNLFLPAFFHLVSLFSNPPTFFNSIPWWFLHLKKKKVDMPTDFGLLPVWTITNTSMNRCLHIFVEICFHFSCKYIQRMTGWVTR